MIYFIQGQKSARVKIGYAKDPQKRLKAMQTGSSEKLEIILTLQAHWICQGCTDLDIEQYLHWRFKKLRTDGEWFQYDGELPLFVHRVKKGEYKVFNIEEVGVKLWARRIEERAKLTSRLTVR